MAERDERFRAAGIYLGVAVIAHLAWETLQLPLYTLWTSSPRWEIAFAVVHCTVGDLMIAASALIAAILVKRSWSWPRTDWKQVALLAASANTCAFCKAMASAGLSSVAF
jgi:hypothetical protein